MSGSSSSSSFTSGKVEDNNMIRQLLDQSYESLFDGKKDAALAAVINAIIMLKGENAVFGIIDKVKAQMKARIDEEAENSDHVIDLPTALKMVDDLLEQDTILAEKGEEDILADAFKDGSSVVCRKCQALIPAHRTEAHQLYWCSAIEDEDL